MLKFITLLLTLLAGIIAIVVIGGVSVGIAVLGGGNAVVGIILLALLFKRNKKQKG